MTDEDIEKAVENKYPRTAWTRYQQNVFVEGARWAREAAAKIAEKEPYCYDAGCFDIQDMLKANIAKEIRGNG